MNSIVSTSQKSVHGQFVCLFVGVLCVTISLCPLLQVGTATSRPKVLNCFSELLKFVMSMFYGLELCECG